MSARPHRPWGPALSSASGAPGPPPAPSAVRSCVRLPLKCGDAFEVFVNGRPQRADVDFHHVGRLVIFATLLNADAPARRRRLRRRAPADRVDVRYALDGHRLTARSLPVDRVG